MTRYYNNKKKRGYVNMTDDQKIEDYFIRKNVFLAFQPDPRGF